MFYTLLTNAGAADLVNAQAFGYHIPLTHLAVGDGGGAAVLPTESMTALVNERFRIGINSISVSPENPNWLLVEAVIPANTGGWTIREIGLIGGLNPVDIASPTPGNKLLAVGNYPETYKPLLTEGAVKDLVIRMIVQVSNASLVELKIDPAVVLATQKNLADAISAHSANAGAHPDIRLMLETLFKTRLLVQRTGEALPQENVGPVWHDDYNSIMTWQVFDQNGANYAGYASILVGSPLMDTQPTPRKGYIVSGAENLGRTAYAALRNWAIHNGIRVAAGTWTAGTVAIKDNADGLTFTVYDLRGEFIRVFDGDRGVDAGRVFGSFQSDTLQKMTGSFGITLTGSHDGAYLIAPNTSGVFTALLNGNTASKMEIGYANASGPHGVSFDSSRVARSAAETRSRNVALPLYVKF